MCVIALVYFNVLNCYSLIHGLVWELQEFRLEMLLNYPRAMLITHLEENQLKPSFIKLKAWLLTHGNDFYITDFSPWLDAREQGETLQIVEKVCSCIIQFINFYGDKLEQHLLMKE